MGEKILAQIEEEYTHKEVEWREHGVAAAGGWRSRSCCKFSISAGRNTWPPWTTCVRALACVRMRKKQPKQEYKRESFELFQELLYNIKRDVVRLLSRVRIEAPSAMEMAERRRREEAAARMRYSHAEASALGAADGCRNRWGRRWRHPK